MAKEGISQVEVWSEQEFGGVNLDDPRRAKRLVRISAGMAECPGRAVSSSCGRSGAQAITRLFKLKIVDVDKVLSEHKRQVKKRSKGDGWIFAIQDTTTLDYTSHGALEGTGPIGSSKHSRGLMMHSVLILTEEKTPLGIAGMQIWARKEEEAGKSRQRRKLPVNEKESNKWLLGAKDAQKAVPKDRNLLVIGDRESDVFALFVAPRRENTYLLVRVAHDRALADEEMPYLKGAVDAAEVCGGYSLYVPRQGKRKARQAKLEVRYSQMTIKPPRHRTSDIPDTPVNVWVVQAKEIDAPDGVEPIEWTLLTTKPVLCLEDALWIIKAYASRWVIEEFHRVLKSECKVESMQFDTVECLAPAIAINAVVAWRVMYLTKLSRETPEMDASAVATESEIDVMESWLEAEGEKLTQIQTVEDFVLAVAYLGGFMSRKKGVNPGPKILCEGLRRLENLLLGYALAMSRRSDKR